MSTDRRKMFLKREQVGGGETPQAFNKQFSFILVLCLFHVSQLRLKGLQAVQILCSGSTHMTKFYIFHRKRFPSFLFSFSSWGSRLIYFHCPVTDLPCSPALRKVSDSVPFCLQFHLGLVSYKTNFFSYSQFPLKLSHEKLIGSYYQ